MRTLKRQPREEKPAHPPGTKLYCWKFYHPRFGWCGGHADDNWSPSKHEIESAMKHCEWRSQLLEKVV